MNLEAEVLVADALDDLEALMTDVIEDSDRFGSFSVEPDSLTLEEKPSASDGRDPLSMVYTIASHMSP